MAYIKNFLDENNHECYRSLAYLKSHIHRNRCCKKPFTSMEVLLAAEYFFDRMIKEANRLKSGVADKHISDKLKESTAVIRRMQEKRGFAQVPKGVPNTLKHKANFVWVVGGRPLPPPLKEYKGIHK